ncbi:MAG: PVC-type heme-binding CxxCH protein, partial [Planctomycetaceae bacterium]
MRRTALLVGWMLALLVTVRTQASEPPQRLELNKGDHVVILGNTLAERMLYFGHFETLLHSRFPEHNLVVRNLGWSADTLTLRMRSKDFQDHGHTLLDHKPNAVIACFGFNESFAGPAGLPQFEKDLEAFLGDLRQVRYPTSTSERGSEQLDKQQSRAVSARTGAARPGSVSIVLVSPIAHEDLGRRTLPDGSANNKNLELYTDAMRRVAEKNGVQFVDLFHPTRKLYEDTEDPLTINGVHLNDQGYEYLATILDAGLFDTLHPVLSTVVLGTYPGERMNRLHAAVQEKNEQFFYDYRAINGYYIYGGRKEPFGVVNFPAEFAKLRKMIANRDERIWKIARGEDVPETIDDSNTGEFALVETNFKEAIQITSPEEAMQHFKLPEGYEISLFASEKEFPDLENPVQIAFDAQGRLWVCTMPSYPMYLPGHTPDDKVLILEDTDGDGKADKQTIFARGLHVPTGIELGDGGAYVAQQPNLVFLKDTDGDDQADVKQLRLHGFDTADSHHSISAFEWGPGGALYFEEGTFHHSQIETPYGPVRCANAGTYRYEPRTEKLDVFASYGYANPWGVVFDNWGQTFIADASGGANYFATAFSGDVDFPHKHRAMQQFLVKQWRPTSGCELVSSRNFPDETQGDYLLNNVIGFHGVLRYRMREEGSGFAADPVEPLVQSSDRNFRPVDLQFGPDGALYLCDWFNPLIGHMQHSLRDPNRDKNHGRIWRVHYTGRPLVEPAKIDGRPVPELLDLLKQYEDRTRYRVRRELRDRDTDEVIAALDQWTAGLDSNDEHYQHHLLEALWVKQHHDVVDEPLLKRLLTSPDYRARAAATRVLCYWRD